MARLAGLKRSSFSAQMQIPLVFSYIDGVLLLEIDW